MNDNTACVYACMICAYGSDLRLRDKKKIVCVPAQLKASCYPNCSPRTPAQLVVFFLLIIFLSSLTFHLPYFVILWSLPGGNFCAGYDLKELANHTDSLKLEQDVTKGPGPMVRAAQRVSVCVLHLLYASFSRDAGLKGSIICTLEEVTGQYRVQLYENKHEP